MNAIEVLTEVNVYAEKYRKKANESIQRNRHMNQIKENENLSQLHIDAILVDFINYMGSQSGIDYGLHTKDLKK